MPVENTEQALPGFELEIVSRAEQDLADIGADIRHKEFTGEMLRVHYPGKYALAARAFFERNRSAESICDILQISPQTMHALVETECAARGFSSVKARIRAKSASVALRTVSELQKLLNDPEAVRKAGIVGLTNALRALTGKEDGGSEEEKPKTEGREDKATDDYIEVYEQSADGFWREKNPAPHGDESTGEPSAANAEPNAATMPGAVENPATESVIQSEGTPKTKGNSLPVAKSVAKTSAESSAEPPFATPSTATEPPHGEGGDPHPTNSAGGEVKFIRGSEV